MKKILLMSLVLVMLLKQSLIKKIAKFKSKNLVKLILAKL